MKKIILAAALVTSFMSISAHADIDLLDETMKAFMSQMGSLKTQDGKSVSAQFATDAIQHFSGSEGNRIRIECESDTECSVIIKILYGRHGAENGLFQEARYDLSLTPVNDTIIIKSVNYKLSEAK